MVAKLTASSRLALRRRRKICARFAIKSGAEMNVSRNGICPPIAFDPTFAVYVAHWDYEDNCRRRRVSRRCRRARPAPRRVPLLDDSPVLEHDDLIDVCEWSQADGSRSSVVRPCISSLIVSMMAASVVGSRAEVGSSSSRMGAFFRKARAMPMRCRCPTLRCPPRSPTGLS